MKTAAVLAFALCGIAAPAGGDEFRAGTESEVRWEGLEYPIRVFVPENYEASAPVPVIFYYHGTNSRPNYGPVFEHTRGRDFILVAMTYLKQGNLDASEENLRAELAQLFAVRDHLGKTLALDERRVYIGGFSKGGWLSSMVAEFGLGRLRGALIMGAGVTARATDLRPEAAKIRPAGSYPVYVGIGQWDGNFLMSVRAVRHFSEIGGGVTFDTFPAIAHKHPGRSEYLEQWLAVEAAGQEKEHLMRAAAAWWMKRRAQLAKLGPLERYLLLKHVSRAPFFPILDPKSHDEIYALLEESVEEGELAGELATEKKYLGIIGYELGDPSTAALMDAMRRYRELAEAVPGTHFGNEAFMQWRRCHLLAANSVARPLPGVAELPEFKRFAESVAASVPDQERAEGVEAYFLDLAAKLYSAP